METQTSHATDEPEGPLTDLPDIHFVSGFLGSGKTTTIVNACRVLQNRGVRTAIVTNDQGSRQVDAAFARLSNIPAVGVSNGCLCCRYDDFEERVLSLAARERPQVIFAESVGSCADIVATVVRPFAAFRASHRPRGLLSAFADIRMLERRLAEHADGERRLPFSDDVLYIFDKQLEEADVIVINKRDLFDSQRAEQVRTSAAKRYPHATILLLSGREIDEVYNWLGHLDDSDRRQSTPVGMAQRPALELDYERYAAGELEMAWLDEELELTIAAGYDADGRIPTTIVSDLVATLTRTLEERGQHIAHLKITWEDKVGGGKLSFTAGDALPEDRELELATSGCQWMQSPVRVTVNIRAVAEPENLVTAMDHALAELRDDTNSVSITSLGRDAFRPGYPKPIHHFSAEA